MTTKYILELDAGVWAASHSGDPGRTTVKASAKRFSSKRQAERWLSFSRGFRVFATAKIEEIEVADAELEGK